MAEVDDKDARWAQFRTFFDSRRRWGLALVERPAGIRPERARVLARGETIRWGPAIERRDSPPISLYDAGGFRLRLLRSARRSRSAAGEPGPW